jgi:hypothetical protein
MQKYLIDANLPYYFSLWDNDNYEHVIDIDPEMKAVKSGSMLKRII